MNTAMQLVFDAPGKAPYDIFISKPECAKAIGTIMSAMGLSKYQRIENVYPIQERLVSGFDPALQDVLLVDVGAGSAHIVSALRSSMPDLPGRLVAQDLATVINSVPNVPHDVEKQVHDFFSEQPIRRKLFPRTRALNLSALD